METPLPIFRNQWAKLGSCWEIFVLLSASPSHERCVRVSKMNNAFQFNGRPDKPIEHAAQAKGVRAEMVANDVRSHVAVPTKSHVTP